MFKRIVKQLLPIVMIFTVLGSAFSLAAENNSITVEKQHEPLAGARYAVWQLSGDALNPKDLDPASAKKLREELDKMSIEELFEAYGQPKLSEPTDSEGKTTISELEDGRYYLVHVNVSGTVTDDSDLSKIIQGRSETKASVLLELPGIDHGEIIRNVVVKPKEDTPPGVEPDSPDTGVELIKRIDSKAGATFKGAVFNLYRIVENGEDILITVDENGKYDKDSTKADLVTDENGKISVTGLPYGTYIFKEKSIPGYTLSNPQELRFTVNKDNKFLTVTAVNVKAGGEKFIKVAESEKGDRLPGAVFKVMVEDTEKSEKDKLVLKEYKDASGKSVTARSNDKGEFEFKNLPFGTYYIQETTAPTGYEPLKDAIKIEITEKSYDDGRSIVVVNKKLEPRKPGVSPDTGKPPTTSGGGGTTTGGGGGTTPAGTSKPGVTIPTTGDIQIFLYAAAGIAVIILGTYMYRAESKAAKTNIG